MDDLMKQIELLEGTTNLSASIDDVQRSIDLLTAARAKIAAGNGPYRDAEQYHTHTTQIPKRPRPLSRSCRALSRRH